jgi:GT2 family glycosyltransferase
MMSDAVLPVSVPRFDPRHYIDSNAKIKEDLDAGVAASALDHYLRLGIDENRYSLVRREPVALQGAVEKFLVSQSGFCLIIGWLADEGCDQPRCRLIGGEFNVEIPVEATFRHARKDVEAHLKGGAYDYGFIAFGRSPSKSLLKQSLLFQVTAVAGAFQAKITPEIVSDRRLLDTLLEIIATFEAHAGKEAVIGSFLSKSAGRAIVELFETHVASAVGGHYVESFGTRPVSHSLVTVLFGSSEPAKIQPLLFTTAKVDIGEWIYVCNSPEDGGEVLRYARLISDLYDVMITVVVMGDNAGFGAANNVAIGHAAGSRIFVVNPDVFPLAAHAAPLRQVLSQEDLGKGLWGGLLFYDDHNLMHSGMYLEEDTFFRRNALNRVDGPDAVPPSGKLLRVEHYDKGVPFVERDWQKARPVPAITGAVMAFARAPFEKLGGFSTRYVYGHYEDADLSLRWGQDIGPVAIHPGLRLVHLEGQGSRARGEQFRGAALVNRYLFTERHAGFFAGHRDRLAKTAGPP